MGFVDLIVNYAVVMHKIKFTTKHLCAAKPQINRRQTMRIALLLHATKKKKNNHNENVVAISLMCCVCFFILLVVVAVPYYEYE